MIRDLSHCLLILILLVSCGSSDTSPENNNPPDIPTGLNAVSGDGEVSLSWNALGDMTYEIHRGDSNDFTANDQTRLATTANGANDYQDSTVINDNQYFYRLIAVNANGQKSEATQSVVANPTARPDTPLASAESGDAVVNLSWTPQATETYAIHRSQTENFTPNNASLIFTTAVNVGQYADTSVENGQIYFYRIIAIEGALQSLPSDPVLGDPVSALAPPPPSVSLEGGNTSITVTMTSATAPDAYVVYYNTTGDVDKGDTVIYNAAPNSFQHTGLTNMQYYYYRVAAVSGGQQGLLSDEVKSFAFVPKSITTQRYPTNITGLFKDVIFTGQQYVVVGNDNIILTSTDRETWVQRNTFTDNPSYRNLVSYGPIVLASSNRGLYRSDDHGTTWSQVTLPAGLSPTSSVQKVFQFGVNENAYFVAFVGSRYLTSPDGLSWNATVMTGDYGTDYAWTGTQFISINSYSLQASSNGINWNMVYEAALDNNFSYTEQFNDLGYANGNYYIDYVTLANAGNPLTQHSTDLSVWQDIPWKGMRYVFYAAGLNQYYKFNSNPYWYSTDGAIWRPAYWDIGGAGLPYTGKWIERNPPAVSHLMGLGSSGTIASSTDGLNWRRDSKNGDVRDMIWDGSRLVAVGPKFTLISTNGSDFVWHDHDYELSDIDYDGNNYTGVGWLDRKPVILSSSDAINWTPVHSVDDSYFLWQSASNGIHRVAVGSAGNILTDAPNGVWKNAVINPATTKIFYKVAWNGNAFVTYTWDPNNNPRTYEIYTSTDGLNWNHTYDMGSHANGILVKDGRFYLAGLNKLVYSDNGSDWQEISTNITPNSLYWDGNKFWSIYLSRLYVSPDGEYWNNTGAVSGSRLIETPNGFYGFGVNISQ